MATGVRARSGRGRVRKLGGVSAPVGDSDDATGGGTARPGVRASDHASTVIATKIVGGGSHSPWLAKKKDVHQ